MKKIILFFAIFFVSSPLYAEDKEVETTLKTANEAFQAANSSSDAEQKQHLYKQALLNYEHLLNTDGYRNGALYYNIANTYFMLDDIGHAILNYRKALRLSPQDENIRTNLEFARKKRVDHIEQASEHSAFRTLLFWHYDLSSSFKYQLAALFSAFFWLLLTAYLLKKNKSYLKLAGASFVMVAILSSSAFINDEIKAAVITAPEVIARRGDGLSYEPSFNEPLHAGTELNIIEKRTDWLHVMLDDGKDAWLPNSSVEEI